MMRLPPLECLRFFEAAARHESFTGAADELSVTAAAVAHRVKRLEEHLGLGLFERGRRSVRLNGRGRAYLTEIQALLSEIHGVTERHRAGERRQTAADRVRRVRGRALAHAAPRRLQGGPCGRRRGGGDGPPRRQPGRAGTSDAWIAYTDGTPTPRPESLLEEPLYDESLFPVCSPALAAERGRPKSAAALAQWPLLYDIGWEADWAYWFARQGKTGPGPVGGLGLPALRNGGGGGGGGSRRRGRTRGADRGRAGGGRPRAGAAVDRRRAGAMQPDHHRGGPLQAGGGRVPTLAGGRAGRRPRRRFPASSRRAARGAWTRRTGWSPRSCAPRRSAGGRGAWSSAASTSSVPGLRSGRLSRTPPLARPATSRARARA